MPKSIRLIRGPGRATKKRMINRRNIATLLLCWSCYLSGCYRIADQWQFHEIRRLRSPDGQVEAVLLTGEAGATTSKATLILLVPTGRGVNVKQLQQWDVVFRADHLKNLEVAWSQPQLLDVRYEEARISQFKNLWEFWEGRDTSYAVEVRLKPTNIDFSVPLADRMPQPVSKSEKHSK